MADDRDSIRRQCAANLADERLFCLVRQPDGSEARKLVADPRDEVLETFCNVAFNRVAHAVGYTELDLEGKPGEPRMANDMIEKMEAAREWLLCDAAEAQRQARAGKLVVAYHTHQGHGHVAVVHPDGGLVFSGRWQCDVPTVCNIGKRNEIIGANWAFDVHETPPQYRYLNL